MSYSNYGSPLTNACSMSQDYGLLVDDEFLSVLVYY